MSPSRLFSNITIYFIIIIIVSCNQNKTDTISDDTTTSNLEVFNKVTDNKAHYFIPSYTLNELTDLISLSSKLSNYYYQHQFLYLLRAHINEYYQLRVCKDPKFHFLAGIEALSDGRITESKNQLKTFISLQNVIKDNDNNYFSCEDTTFNTRLFFQELHKESSAYQFAKIILNYLNMGSTNLEGLQSELFSINVGNMESNQNFAKLIYYILLDIQNNIDSMIQYFDTLDKNEFYVGSFDLFGDKHSYYYFSSQIDMITKYIHYFISKNIDNLNLQKLFNEEYYLDQLIKISNLVEYEYKEFGHSDNKIINLITEGIKTFESKYPKSDWGEYETYNDWVDLYNPSIFNNSSLSIIFNINRKYAENKFFNKIANMIKEYDQSDSTSYFQFLNSTINGRLVYEIYDYDIALKKSVLIPQVKDSIFIKFSKKSRDDYEIDNNLLVHDIGWAFHNIYSIDAYNEIYDILSKDFTENNLGVRPLIESLKDFRMSTNPRTGSPGSE